MAVPNNDSAPAWLDPTTVKREIYEHILLPYQIHGEGLTRSTLLLTDGHPPQPADELELESSSKLAHNSTALLPPDPFIALTITPEICQQIRRVLYQNNVVFSEGLVKFWQRSSAGSVYTPTNLLPVTFMTQNPEHFPLVRSLGLTVFAECPKPFERASYYKYERQGPGYYFSVSNHARWTLYWMKTTLVNLETIHIYTDTTFLLKADSLQIKWMADFLLALPQRLVICISGHVADLDLAESTMRYYIAMARNRYFIDDQLPKINSHYDVELHGRLSFALARQSTPQTASQASSESGVAQTGQSESEDKNQDSTDLSSVGSYWGASEGQDGTEPFPLGIRRRATEGQDGIEPSMAGIHRRATQ